MLQFRSRHITTLTAVGLVKIDTFPFYLIFIQRTIMSIEKQSLKSALNRLAKGNDKQRASSAPRVKASSGCSELGPVTAPGANTVGSSVGKRRESDGNAVADSHSSPRLNVLKCHHDCGRTDAAEAQGVGRTGHSHRDEWL